jgi:hypothetical protein
LNFRSKDEDLLPETELEGSVSIAAGAVCTAVTPHEKGMKDVNFAAIGDVMIDARAEVVVWFVAFSSGRKKGGSLAITPSAILRCVRSTLFII